MHYFPAFPLAYFALSDLLRHIYGAINFQAEPHLKFIFDLKMYNTYQNRSIYFNP